MRMLSVTKRRTPLRCAVHTGDVWALGGHRLLVGAAPGDIEVAEVVLRAYGLYTGLHARLVERSGTAADHGAAGQLTHAAYEAGYARTADYFGLVACGQRVRRNAAAAASRVAATSSRQVERIGAGAPGRQQQQPKRKGVGSHGKALHA